MPTDTPNMGTTEQKQRYCMNCHYPLPEIGEFCPQCSQKYTTGKVKLHALFSELLDALYSLDGRFFLTLRDIWVPGKLTSAYFKGKHRSYMHPLRIFLLAALIHFALIGHRISGFLEQSTSELKSAIERTFYHTAFYDSLDQRAQQLKASYPSADVKLALDSLLRIEKSKATDSTSLALDFGILPIKDSTGKVITVTDIELLNVPFEDIVKQKGVTDFWSQIQLKQKIAFLRNPDRYASFLLGNLVWMVLLMLVVLSLVLKLFYIRRDRYLIEHFIYLLHIHTFGFLVVSLVLGFGWDNWRFWLWGWGALILYSLLTMFFYYRQSFGKTLLKFLSFGLMYIILFSTFLGLTAVGSFFLF
jgi:hypothetical protein